LSFCPNFSLVVFQETDTEKVIMKRLRCQSWGCSYCARENRRLWAAHLRNRLPKVADRWWFITLTAHEALRTPENSLDNIRKNIDRLMKRLRRIYGKIHYVRVFEVHKKGAFHAHLLMAGLSDRLTIHAAANGILYFRPRPAGLRARSWSIKTWLKKSARALGMGYMVDVQKLDQIPEAVRYIVKYLTKDAQAFTAKNLRRVQTTQQIGGLRQGGGGGWRVKARVFRTDVPPGKSLYDIDRKRTIPAEYWRDNLTYPRPGE